MRARDFEKTCRLDGSAAGDLEEKSTTKAACIEVLRRWKLEVGPVSRMAARLSGEAPWKRFEQELEELGRGRAAAVWLLWKLLAARARWRLSGGEAALAEDLVRACVERSLESAVSNGYLNVTTAAPGEVAVDMSTYDPQFEPDEEGAEEELEELARLVSRWQLSRGEVFVEPSARLPEAPPDLVDVPAGVRSFKFPFDSEGLSCVVRFESASGELLAEASGGSGIVPLGAARASITTASGRPWSGWFKFER